MKKLFLLLALVAVSGVSLMAQDPSKDLKNAEKGLRKYIQDPSNVDALNSSLALLESAFKSEELRSEAKSWITRGKIFNELANAEFKKKTLDPNYVIVNENAAVEAFKAYKEASKLAEKKNDLKDVESGLKENESHLNNFAIFAYQVQDYNAAFQNFKASIEAHNLLKELGYDSRLDEENFLNDQYFYASISGYYGDYKEEVEPFLVRLYDNNSQEPFVYEALYNLKSASDPADAVVYLEKGRELFPDDTGLLFAEINHYLKEGKLDLLIGKLELALEKEPDNVSIFNTLGSVYDQLHQKAEKDGDDAKSQEYFDKALNYYNAVLEKDPNNFDATYSVGALYYNKAATYVEKLNELAADFSTEGMKKYDAAKAEMDGVFKQALPYFEAAEQLNANDLNTLIALKEIHARLNNLEKSEEYKMKMDKITGDQ